MTTVALTGGIGSGKSAAAAFLSSAGVPVFDCDAAAKAVYDEDPALPARLEKRLGTNIRKDGAFDRKALAAVVFSSPEALRTVEEAVLPAVLAKLEAWKASLSSPLCVVESATILSKPLFDGAYDSAVLVDAPEHIRLRRILSRGGISLDDAIRRIGAQSFDSSKISGIILNDNNLRTLRARTFALFSSLYGDSFHFSRKNS